MSNQTESRGWEIEDNYHEHVLDAPDVDITEYAEGHVAAFIGFVVVLAVFIAGIFGLQEWTRPPVLVFPKISVPSTNIIGQPGWNISCIYFNPSTKVLRPNYGSPLCTEAAAKKRGQL